MNNKNQKIILNEKHISEEDFEKRKKELEKKPGVKIVEIGNNIYKTRIQG